MEKLKRTFLILSLVAIFICFGASVWLYLKGFGMLYMLLFFVALLWQCRMVWVHFQQKDQS